MRRLVPMSAIYVVFSTILLASNVVQASTVTRDNGAAVGDNQNSQTAGPAGPVLLQDGHLIQKLQRFDRERIPERVVHARGAGAQGEFHATADISNLTQAAVFTPGTITPVMVRFSTVVHSSGSPETLRDPRGFATKFYTTQGNWDLVGNNLPVFFIRDAIKFPDMVHSLKPSPVTNVQRPERFFDFFSHQPESTHMLTRLYTDLGTPVSYRMMDGFGVHAFKFVNKQGQFSYVKFAWRSKQGVKGLDAMQVAATQAKDFNHLTNDLYHSISQGIFPSWDLTIQILKPEQFAQRDYDPLDATKIWPDVPEQVIGTMTLNKVPDNFFEYTEQVALAPSNLVPGIEPSEDRLLQGRLFSYADTQLYRLGANHGQLTVNRPRSIVSNNNQNGAAANSGRQGETNYEPSRFSAQRIEASAKNTALPLTGTTQQLPISKPRNFIQAGEYYRSLSAGEKHNLIVNLAADLGQVKNPDTLYTMLSYFTKADLEYGRAITKAVNADFSKVMPLIDRLSD
jgi:catalase